MKAICIDHTHDDSLRKATHTHTHIDYFKRQNYINYAILLKYCFINLSRFYFNALLKFISFNFIFIQIHVLKELIKERENN